MVETVPDDWVYEVIINCNKTYYAQSEDEAWDIIGKQRFGSCHIVYDRNGHVAVDFIPF